jgi:hypothetical protein
MCLSGLKSPFSASNDLYEQQQNYPSETANYRSRTCQTNRDPAFSVDSRFDGHERFRQQKPDHHTGGGGGYLQEVRLYFGRYLSIMSELQDKLDRGEITLDEYHASWIWKKMNDFIPAFTTGSMNI